MRDAWASRYQDIVDSHVHMGGLAQRDSMLAVRDASGSDTMSLVCIQDAASGSGLAAALSMKARHPDWFYVFAGLNHGSRKQPGPAQRAPGVAGPAAPPLADQAAAFMAMGCDGMKMIEGKPTSRQSLPVPVTDPYYEDYWAAVESLRIPVLWHVNDPEEFWDPARIPGWAKERNWGYGPGDVQKEQLYAEVDEVLRRHPGLLLTFAHFYFLSADLGRASRFLEEHPTVCLDLAPGVEMLYNISRAPQAGREFFVRYADRIVFGTDNFASLTPEQARFRSGIVYRWLETDETFTVPDGADFLLGPPTDGVVHGLALPEEALARIYRTNYRSRVGERPKPLNIGRTVEECERIARLAQGLSGTPAGDTEAGRVAAELLNDHR